MGALDLQATSSEPKQDVQHEAAIGRRTYVGFIVGGMGLGWLIGLSASPVVGTVVAAVVAAMVALQASLAGLGTEAVDSKSPTMKVIQSKVNIWPMVVLTLGLAVGSCVGITARTHDWFSPSFSTTLRRWTEAGLDAKLVTTRLFENSYPNTTGPSVDRSVLFAAEAVRDCTKLKLVEDKDLRRQMLGSTVPGVAQFASKVENPAALRAAVESFVCE